MAASSETCIEAVILAERPYDRLAIGKCWSAPVVCLFLQPHAAFSGQWHFAAQNEQMITLRAIKMRCLQFYRKRTKPVKASTCVEQSIIVNLFTDEQYLDCETTLVHKDYVRKRTKPVPVCFSLTFPPYNVPPLRRALLLMLPTALL